MRVSVDKNDRGYTELSSAYNVYINGKINTDCITVDEETGYVLCHEKGVEPNYTLYEITIPTKKFYAEVRVELNEDLVVRDFNNEET